MTELSWTFVPGPMRTYDVSARIVTPNQTEAPDAISTSPMMLAVGAIQASSATFGTLP